jgi:PAS domain S-box-containing protein
MNPSSISVEALGKITLLQSMVIHLHDNTKIVDAVCHELEELPGIDTVSYFPDSPAISKTLEIANQQTLIYIKYKGILFGYFILTISDTEKFSGYLPFIQNFMNMLGVIFEERHQRAINAELTEQLELRVQQRTKELHEQTENLRITFNSIGDAILVTDVTGIVTALNPVAEKLTGWHSGDAVGQPADNVFRIINAKSRQTVCNPIELVLTNGKKVNLANHTILISKNGIEYQIADSAAPIRAQDGAINGAVLVFRDVTEEYRVHKDLIESEDKYRRLIEGIGPRYCVICQSPQGIFTYASKNFERLFGIPAENAIGKSWNVLNITPESIIASKEADQRLRVHKIFQRVEMTVIHPDNRQKIIELYFGPVIENESIIRIEGICTDITDQKKAEQILLRTQKLDSLGTLAGGIAHDFNNLLAGIYGYITIASDASHETPVKDYLSKTLATIDRARALTNQLLTFSKGGEPQKTTRSVLPLLPDTVQFALSGSNISYEFRFAENLWPCEFDYNQIGQVLDNIVINAKQAMPQGGILEVTADNITIKGKSRGAVPEGKWVKLAVIDHGTGISADNLPRIFDPFFTTKPKGHGLGLATSHSIIARHGGYIEVESILNQGSSFSIYLPASKNDTMVESEKMFTETKCSGTIILMDDEDFMLATTSAILQSVGYDTVCCRNGKEVLDLLILHKDQLQKFRGMIFDLTIPGAMGGRETIDIVRKIAPTIPVFVASGYADDPVMANPSHYGFTASICKPFRKKELIEMLSRFIK